MNNNNIYFNCQNYKYADSKQLNDNPGKQKWTKKSKHLLITSPGCTSVCIVLNDDVLKKQNKKTEHVSCTCSEHVYPTHLSSEALVNKHRLN